MREAIIEFWPSHAGGKPTMADFDDDVRFASLVQQAQAVAYRTHHTADEQDAAAGYSAGLLSMALQSLLWEVESNAPLGKCIAGLFEVVAEKHLIQPTIIYEFPLAVSPLSKQKPDEPDWVERFEFYIGGFELGNAFSELNDPEEQRRRFEEQVAQHARGDEEAHQMDVDYVRALAYGMPPTAGEGIGIDRLTMILTGAKSIRDVILFPLLKPQAEPSKP